jgi:hypothetical protein
MDFILLLIDDISLHKENKGNEGVTNIQSTRSTINEIIKTLFLHSLYLLITGLGY